MNLIDAYVYEVTRRLPEKTRDDIALELRSTIEDMLPENPSEEDTKKALVKLGNPAALATSYRDTPKYLIGPKVYDSYIQTLKKVIPWAILVILFLHTAISIFSFTGEEAILSVTIKTFGAIIANIINMLMYAFFWITIVFIAIERIGLAKVDALVPKNQGTWTPDELKNVQIIPKKKVISKGDVVFSLIWTAIWALVYFNADHLVGAYRSLDGSGLQFVMPLFNQGVLLSYWPIIVILILLEIGLAVYKWKAIQWTMKLASVDTIIRVLGVITFIVIASNPNLINEAMIPYLAQIFETSAASVENFLKWIWKIIVASIVIPTMIEVLNSYRKARIR